MKFAATFYKKRRCAIIAIRKKQLTVRFTEEEYAALKGKCEIAGMKMEPFVRALVDGCRIKPAPPDSYNKLRQQLSAMFKNTLLLAQQGNEKAMEKLLNRYDPLLKKCSIIQGHFDEDLYQSLILEFVRAVSAFKI